MTSMSQSQWRLFFRDPENTTDWTLDSYDVVTDADGVDDLCDLIATFSPAFKWGSFFLMRDGVPPLWEHPRNAPGGCISFTVPVTDTSTYMASSAFGVVSGEYDFGDAVRANGVSVASKKGYSLIRIWTDGHPRDMRMVRIPETAVVHFKPHRDSISGKKTCLSTAASQSLHANIVNAPRGGGDAGGGFHRRRNGASSSRRGGGNGSGRRGF